MGSNPREGAASRLTEHRDLGNFSGFSAHRTPSPPTSLRHSVACGNLVGRGQKQAWAGWAVSRLPCRVAQQGGAGHQLRFASRCFPDAICMPIRPLPDSTRVQRKSLTIMKRASRRASGCQGVLWARRAHAWHRDAPTS